MPHSNMKPKPDFCFCLTCFLVEPCPPVQATIVLDDNWADGTRNNTILPTESARYSSTTADLTASIGALTGTVPATTSRMWLTYFTSTATNPVQIAAGQMLKLGLTFTPTSVAAQNANRSFRVGFFNFADGGPTDGGWLSTGSSGAAVKVICSIRISA